MSFVGELSALAAALFWALASVIYRQLGSTLSPLVLNGVKGAVSIGLLCVTMVIASTTISFVDTRAIGILFLSGAIGIGLGDTAFFAALNSLGERRTVLTVETSAPPMAVILSVVILSEFLTFGALAGITTTLIGVCWVLSEKKRGGSLAPVCWTGIAWAALASLCQALGGVMSRGVLVNQDISPLWSSTIRLTGGFVFVTLALLCKRKKVNISGLIKTRTLKPLMVAIVFGTFLAIILQQVSLSYTNAAITQTLIATSAIFILPFVAFLGETVSRRTVVGSVIALGGIVLLFFYK